MRLANGLLVRLKEELQQGNLENTIDVINNLTDCKELVQIREQKLLFKIQNDEQQKILIDAYKNAAKRLIVDENERRQERNYADFTQIVFFTFQQLTKDTNQAAKKLTSISPVELLGLSSQLQMMFTTSIHSRLETIVPDETENLEDIERSDLGEYYLHEFNGDYNELMFALVRVINEILPITNSRKTWGSGNRVINAALEDLKKLITIANYWNGIEYALDCVTYGEWFVEELSMAPVQVVLGIRDVRLQRARTIGIRRGLISRHFYRKNSDRYIKDIFRGFIQDVTDDFIDKFTDKYDMLNRSQFIEVHGHTSSYVDSLEAEDDFLIAAAAKSDEISILGLYAASLTIRCYTTVAYYYKNIVSRRKSKELITPEIPVEEIISVANKHMKANGSSAISLKEAIRKGVYDQILNLPVPRFLAIQSRPYFRLSDNKVYGLKEIEDSNWGTHIRTDVVHGNKISDAFGDIIEEYLEFLFAGNEWIVLGRGINIKRTDIDLLVFKNGLLLVIQVKGIARGGFNMYEHWKSRETIIKGAVQAKIAEEVIQKRPSLITHLMASKKIKQAVEYIQPVVVTNSPLFSGWSYENIPVIGIGSLTGIFNGAKVEFKNSRQEIVSIKRFISGDEPTVDEFLGLLKTPFEWRIARDEDTIEYRLVSTPYISITYPFLKRSQQLV